MTTASDYRRQLDSLLADYKVAKAKVRSEIVGIIETEDRYSDAKTAQEVIQAVAQDVQQRAHKKIAAVVSKCLESVFDEPYEFKVEFERKRGRTEAKLTFVRDDIVVSPLSASGGGVVDVAAFALRLACLVLTRPPLRKVLVLDEPFKNPSAEYLPRIRIMLESLAEEMGVQFIIVTHIEALRCGEVVEMGR